MIGDQKKSSSKSKKHEALKNFDAILKVADGIMIARGDLGVGTAAEDVPLHQKSSSPVPRRRQAGGGGHANVGSQ